MHKRKALIPVLFQNDYWMKIIFSFKKKYRKIFRESRFMERLVRTLFSNSIRDGARRLWMDTGCDHQQHKIIQLKLSWIQLLYEFKYHRKLKFPFSKPNSTRIVAALKNGKRLSWKRSILKAYEFKILSEQAKLLLLNYSMTYFCEEVFSIYKATKAKYRSRRIRHSSETMSNWTEYSKSVQKNMQPQVSH